MSICLNYIPSPSSRYSVGDFVPISDFFRDDDKGPLVLPGNSGESRLAIVSGVIRMKRNASDHALSAQEGRADQVVIDPGAR